jgi:hypothetical protein
VLESSSARSRVGERSELVQRADGRDSRSGEAVLLPRIGLRIPPRFSYERWLAMGKQLSSLASSSAWCLGDWLTYGEAAFNGRYREAIEHTSLDYQTLRNYAWVAKRFPMSRRRDTLSFGHHTEVAALPFPEQDFWLRKAEEFGWSCKELRRKLRASLVERDSDHRHELESVTEGGEAQSRSRLQVELSSVQLESCRTAADKVGLSLDEWIVLVLEQAAIQTLS